MAQPGLGPKKFFWVAAPPPYQRVWMTAPPPPPPATYQGLDPALLHVQTILRIVTTLQLNNKV